MKALLVLFMVFSSSIYIKGENSCPPIGETKPCVCYPTLKTIVCSKSANNLTNFKVLKPNFQIDTLSITDSHIDKINESVFKNLIYKKLIIQNNAYLVDINPLTFDGLITETLAIRNNSFKITEDFFNIFTTFKVVKEVYLDNNDIQKLPKYAFVGRTTTNTNTQINLIHLKNNLIISIDVNAFDNLNNLKEVNLENNKLNALPGIIFKGHTGTLNLFFGRNLIEKIDLQKAVNSEIKFYIDNNKMKKLPISVLKPIFNNKGELYVANNPFECECDYDSFEWIFEYKFINKIHDLHCENQMNLEFFDNCAQPSTPRNDSIRTEPITDPSTPAELTLRPEPKSEPPTPEEDKIRNEPTPPDPLAPKDDVLRKEPTTEPTGLLFGAIST